MLAAPHVDHPVVHFLIENRVLYHALAHVAETAGWLASTTPGEGASMVSDHVQPGDEGVVLVVEPTPAGCRAGLDAVVAGQARAVVCADQPDALPDALAAVDEGWCLVPSRVVELASSVPALTPRQHDISQAILAGQSNRAIARALHVSEATVKREAAGLFQTFDTSNRLALVSRLVSLGLTPRRLHA